MIQLLQNLANIAPYILVAIMCAAALSGLWLISQLRKDSPYQRDSMSDRLFLKRNAARMRKVQLQ